MDFWHGPENITLHCVDSTDTWPPPVQDLARLLTPSLPHWVHDGPYPFLSKDAKYLSSELSNLRCMPSSMYDSGPSDAPTLDGRLARAFDTALSVTAILRTILSAESKSPHEGSTKVAFLATLVRNVMLFCMPDAWVCESAPFVLPRHPKSLLNPLAKFTRTTSIASLLICCTAEGFQEPLARSQSTNCESELDDAAIHSASSRSHSSLESEPQRYTMEDFALGYRRTESSDISEGSGDADSVNPINEHLDESYTGETVDPALGAHLLAHASSSDTPAIPIVCMADSDEIYGLMASTLYQRHVWHIHEPVIGLTFSKLATGIQVVFGWLDEDETPDPNLLPTVHIAYCCGATYSGVFDICDPLSTLRLCSFLLSLDHHIDRIRTLLSESSAGVTEDLVNGNALIWRSDFQKTNSDSRDSGKRTISDWATEVAIALGPSEKSLIQDSDMPPKSTADTLGKRAARSAPKPSTDPSGSSSSPNRTLLEEGDMPPKVPADTGLKRVTRSSTRQMSEPASTVASDSPSITYTSPDSLPEHLEGTEKSTRTKRYSCSEFAAGGGKKDKDELTLRWLSDRFAVATSFPLIETEDTSMKAITKVYDDYTSYCWPKAWGELDDLPQVDAGLQQLREELFTANAVRNAHAKHGRTPPSKELPTDILAIIQSKLSVILRACKHARRRNHYAQQRQVPEVETRHDWDTLLMEFMSSETSNVFPFLERSLNMPRNQAADNRHNDKFDDYSGAYNTYVRNESAHCDDYAKHAKKEPVVREGAPELYSEAAKQEAMRRSAQARAVAGQLLQVQTMWRQITEDDAHAHATKDPLTGKCDAIATLYIPDFFSDHKPPLKDFVLFSQALAKSSPSQKSTKTTKSESGISSNPRGSGSAPTDLLRVPSGDPASSLKRDADPSVHSDIFASTRNEAVFSESQGVEDVTKLTEALSISPAPPVLPKGSGTGHSLAKAYSLGLDLPLIVTEYKKLHDDFVITGVNQGRMYSVACCQFLVNLGITEFPVFALVTEGSLGVATCTYAGPRDKPSTTGKSAKTAEKTADAEGNYIRVLEGNARAFDIATPLGAYHYVVFLCILASRHASEMKKRLALVKEEFLRKHDTGDESLRWTLKLQMEKLKKAARS